jgi:hypothetical protein
MKEVKTLSDIMAYGTECNWRLKTSSKIEDNKKTYYFLTPCGNHISVIIDVKNDSILLWENYLNG